MKATSANSVRRRARPTRWWWLPENQPIRRKLWSILAIPTALLLVLAGVAVTGSAREAIDANRLVALARLSQASGELADALSQERASAALALLGQPAGLGQNARAVDESMAAWRAVADKIADRDRTEAVRRTQALMDGLPDLRIAVTDAQQHTAFSLVLLRYQLVIAALLEIRQGLVAAGAPAQTAERVRAAVALSQAAEATGMLQTGVARATAMGPLSPATAAQIAATRAAYTQALRDWDTAALPQWRAQLDQALSGEQLLVAQRLDGVVSRTAVGERISLPREQWMQAQDARQQRLRQVIATADAEIVTMLEAWGRQRAIIAVAAGGGTGGALLLSLLLASFVARRTVRSLERLRNQATEVAHTGLPAAVAMLSSTPFADGVDGRTAAARNGVVLDVTGADEVAAVTRSFNAVAGTALEQAIALVRSRDGITRLIVDLGRRQQILIDALLAGIDAAEKQETDGDRLERLFKIDHLAARMWRSNRNLLLLGGVPTAVTYSTPESLHNVLTAAIGYVEDYTRTSIIHADEVFIRPAAIAPVVQALVELVDNAALYSRGPVEIAGRRVGDRVVVEITDTGIGMQPKDLLAANDLLSGRVAAEPGVRHMGLPVVARVAAEHGLTVVLHGRGGPGLTAEVTLPWSALQPASHRHSDVPAAVMPPRLMDRRAGAGSVTAASTDVPAAAAAVTDAGLPMRSRDLRAGAATSRAVVIAPRDLRARALALSAIQHGQQAARAGRPTTPLSEGAPS
ncbi:nitrate- and nitrite sensing domain-containing protein [Catellatospora sp. NPDC049111]|uniref:sensor histidine kinase n=1 Tax=Catellatospora sp. NPDC049111 TaxID=3155271 RepID=UPI0033FB1D5B